MSDIDWKAVASWCDKEASEHAKVAGTAGHDVLCELFAGLSRALRYGIETAELARAKERMGWDDGTIRER